MKKKMLLIFVFLFGAMSLLTAQTQTAESLINDGMTNFKSKKYKEAISSLQLAITEINKAIMSDLISKLPTEINGFKAEISEDNGYADAGMNIMGGGLTITRKYVKTGAEDNYFEVSIIGNSPMVSSLTMMFSNSMILSSMGAKLIKVGTKNGILNQGSDPYTFQVPLTASLITVTGYGFKSEAEFTGVATQINYDLIATTLGE